MIHRHDDFTRETQRSEQDDLPAMRLTSSVHREISETIGAEQPETGGILGGSWEDFVVRHFRFDEFAERSGGSYSPDCDFLNRLLTEQWNPAGIRMLGFCHSHPLGSRRPSRGDLVYAARILQANAALSQLLLPIVMPERNGTFVLLPFRAVREGNQVFIEDMKLEIVENHITLPATSGSIHSGNRVSNSPGSNGRPATNAGRPRAMPDPPSTAVDERNGPRGDVATSGETAAPPDGTQSDGTAALPATPLIGPAFCRVETAYDIPRLTRSRLVVIGVGGARQFILDMARAAVSDFVLVDPDTVTEPNLATQHVFRSEIGQSKVACLQHRILDINPAAKVQIRQQRIEELDDRQLAAYLWTPDRQPIGEAESPRERSVEPVSLVCGFTDQFFAQARVNRIGLKFGVPTLCAQVYAAGNAAEITFTYPGVTEACHRCVLSARYEAYLQEGYQNDVTSQGTPIFSTSRLNALKGFVAMAILHHGTDHPRWGNLLSKIGLRNLIQIRMNPDLNLPVFQRVFSGGDGERILFDDVVWLPQRADHPSRNGLPACPDCGGTGDLRNRIGQMMDTRSSSQVSP